jgi:cysteine desulfurase/selenocysteine lyase
MNTPALADNIRPFDVEAIRREFPILSRSVRGKPLAYLDNGASSRSMRMPVT